MLRPERSGLAGHLPRCRLDGGRQGVKARGGTAWVSLDGTMVHDRASGTELEVKIGFVFDGTRRTGRNRRVLTGRTLDAGTETWTGFAERFTALCTQLGVYEADRICFVSDGAASIRWIRERSFPDAIELLDWYHLVEALRRASVTTASSSGLGACVRALSAAADAPDGLFMTSA